MKIIYAIQSLAFEDLGSFTPILQQLGYEIRYRQLGVDDMDDILNTPDPIIILGGPIGVYETQDYPYLSNFIQQLKLRLKQHHPTLGICLGAQLIAAALGAHVYSGPSKEIGWSPLTLSIKGQHSPLRHLNHCAVLHWHGDTFDLPDSADLLASSRYYPHQAFAIGQYILALQCHIEIDPHHFERWLIGHHVELRQANIDIVTLRQDHLRYSKQLQQQAQLVLIDWFKSIHSNKM
ncbi:MULTISPECIES: glutamine amidotransferase [unclassified Acinetobacter]|uniref:glutamine amidotransferase n=1 Tax=unclassified Acinetobacter TaxID=196816 RepID=UPI002934B730|nr:MULTISPECIES: glutamine amidotransferase [unclassified Acinetobacter]WOE31738.1 glutamine amidotransferase [Acinetobacter sp. SAAs470]WOE37205.1 glutamine amidotransferase [Acinetobacter sp. SAAs474]